MEKFAALVPEVKRHLVFDSMKAMKDVFSGVQGLKTTEWKGHRFVPGFLAENAKYAYEEMKIKENSIFLVSYPKTGGNWTAEIISQMIYGPTAPKMFPPIRKLEVGKATKFELLEYLPTKRNFFLTHLPSELVNLEKIKESGSKVVIILRNPKDQVVSWYHFTENKTFDNAREAYSRDWTQFFSDFVQGKTISFMKDGEWYLDHLLGWYKHKDEDNVMFLFYEDLKKDIKQEITRLSNFLDVELSDDRMEEIVEATSFTNMKKNANPLMKNLNVFRKGEVGSWKDMLTIGQSEHMDKLVEEKLGHTDIKFTYKL